MAAGVGVKVPGSRAQLLALVGVKVLHQSFVEGGGGGRRRRSQRMLGGARWGWARGEGRAGQALWRWGELWAPGGTSLPAAVVSNGLFKLTSLVPKETAPLGSAEEPSLLPLEHRQATQSFARPWAPPRRRQRPATSLARATTHNPAGEQRTRHPDQPTRHRLPLTSSRRWMHPTSP